MSWQPKYTLTHKLLMTMRDIGEAMGRIKSYPLTKKTLARLQLDARELSIFASTSIEGNPLALTDVKRLLKTQKTKIRDTEREVLNYNNSLQTLYQAVRSDTFTLDIPTLERVQQQVTQDLMDNPAECGHLRQAPVIIRNPRNMNEIVFIPPDAKDVRQLLGDLIIFINHHEDNIDPIILAGLFHRQCVIIHPFMDGNGRTTRLLTTAILGKAGLDLFEIFSFEHYYNQNISRYFKYVGLFGDYYEQQDAIDFTEWLEYFAEGILDELMRIQKTLPKVAHSPRLEPHHQQVLEYIKERGSITQREYAQISKRSLAIRKLDIQKLLDLELIVAKGKGRGLYYVLQDDND
jgi:Fic family protein